MNIQERISAVTDKSTKVAEIIPTPAVQATIDRSNLPSILTQLPETWKTEKLVVESGEKVIFDIKWDMGKLSKRMVVSVRENRIAFMGDFLRSYYLVLEGEEISSQERVEQCFLETVVNAQTFLPKIKKA